MTPEAKPAGEDGGQSSGAGLTATSEEAVIRIAVRWNLTEEMARRRLRKLLDEMYELGADDRNMQAAALWYAKNGIPVFPLHWPTAEGCSCGKNPGEVPENEVCKRSRGKHPRTANGFKDATTDVNQITEWWQKWPDANIGVPTGVLTGLLVVDDDPRNGGPTDRSGLVAVLGPIPETAEALTGGDGRHLYFQYGGGRVRKQLAKGIDLKGDGGYVVAPPSLHLSGKRYQWDCAGGAGAILHPAPAPEWLLKFIADESQEDTYIETKSRSPLNNGGKVGRGGRHGHLVSQAGAMRRRGMSQQAIEAALLAENRERCDPPKSDAEVRQIAKSMERYPSGGTTTAADTPEGWPEIIPLDFHLTDSIPANVLPGWLGAMATAVSANTETPTEMAAILALSVASSCVASKADVSPETGYTEPLNLYVCALMESGNRKTAVLNKLMAPLVTWERTETGRILPEQQRLWSEFKTGQLRIDKLRKQAAAEKDPVAAKQKIQNIIALEKDLPEIPVLPRLFTDDVTTERLASLMQQQGERIAVFSDEGGIFDTIGGRYSKGVPNLDLWLKGHAGSPVRVDRQNPDRPPIVINKPCLTVGLSPQPDVVAALREKPGFRGRGLLPRFLFVLPPSRLGYRSLAVNPVPQDVETGYETGITSLLSYRPDPMVHLTFTADAYREWKEFQRGIEPQFRDGGMLEELKDWGSKLPGAVARIAGVFHLVKHAGSAVVPSEIELSTVTSAIELAVPLISHCRAAFALMERALETKKAERVLAWIQRQRCAFFIARDCFRAHQQLFKQATALMPTLILLQQHGYVRVDRQLSSGGRPPSDLVAVNPVILSGGTE